MNETRSIARTSPRLVAGLALSLSLALFAGCDDDRPPADGGSVATRMDGGRGSATDAGPAENVDAGPRDRTCRGVATSCPSLPTRSCSSQRGCRLGGDCGGLSTSCYSLFDSYSCSRQDGCYWSTYSDNCSGSARSCSGYSTSSSCIGQRDCSWDSGCDGYETPCSLLDEATCELQQGCYLD